jgi:undecaprenyl-phosphate galactose phosphotransferase
MLKMSYRRSKRIFDIVLSLSLLIILSPILLLISFFIWIADHHEVFVKEPLRLGMKGKEFKMYKFRTMIPNAHKEIQNNPKYAKAKEKWVKHDGKLKIAEDPRITFVGKLLRKTDMDELPQLLNVLKGDMSIVGPRPMYLGEVDRYLGNHPEGKKYYKRRLRVRPGMTGIWQISGRNDIKFKDRMIMEAKYAANVNFKDDIKIFFKTPFVVFTRRGVYE